MSDWRSGFALAVNDRILADTGSGGIFNVGSPLAGAVYLGFLPSRTAIPAIVHRTVDASNDDSFPAGRWEIEWALDIYVPKGSTTVSAPYDRANKIAERLVGDCWEQSGRLPSFGFHHWTPAAVGGWTFGGWNEVLNAGRDVSDSEAVHLVIECRLAVNRDGV